MKTGFRLRNIYVIDGSKRSTKANAYFSGFGPKKRIVLYDTLLKEFTDEEIVAVLAHEIGHYKKKHVLRGLVFSVILTGLMLFLFSLVVDNPNAIKGTGCGSSRLPSRTDSLRNTLQPAFTVDRTCIQIISPEEMNLRLTGL